jgi:chromosome segregation ATPase
MPKTIDEQIAEVERQRESVVASLARLDKRRAELNRRMHELHRQRERLTLAKLVGQTVKLKAGTSRYLGTEFREAAEAGLKLVKVNRKRAVVEANSTTWTVPLDYLQDPAAGLEAGMIL